MATIICLIGADGSGKTTIAHSLVSILTRKGFTPKYVWCRWFPGPADPFHFVVRKTLGYDIRNYESMRPLKLLYQILLFLGHTIWLTPKIRLANNDIIIIDRYLYDLFADLYINGLHPSALFMKLMLLANPKPNITFLIDVPPEVIHSRRKDVSVQASSDYRKAFARLDHSFKFVYVNNVDFSDACKQIMDEIRSRVSDFVER